MSKKFAVQSNVIRRLSKLQYSMLREMCQYANNLYNVALYNIRQHFFESNKYLSYESNYHECKLNENYGMLQAGVAQQLLLVADRSFQSFFSLLKKCGNGGYDSKKKQDPALPEQGRAFQPDPFNKFDLDKGWKIQNSHEPEIHGNTSGYQTDYHSIS